LKFEWLSGFPVQSNERIGKEGKERGKTSVANYQWQGEKDSGIEDRGVTEGSKLEREARLRIPHLVTGGDR